MSSDDCGRPSERCMYQETMGPIAMSVFLLVPSVSTRVHPVSYLVSALDFLWRKGVGILPQLVRIFIVAFMSRLQTITQLVGSISSLLSTPRHIGANGTASMGDGRRALPYTGQPLKKK